MTQNLSLGTSAITLTPADSDVTTNFTIPASAIQTSGGVNWSSSVDSVHVFSNGDVWVQPTSVGNNSAIHTTGTPPSQSQYAGNYYNWYTATAGTGITALTSGDAPSSICPKGWRLPTGGPNSDFTGLTGALVGITTYSSDAPNQSFALQSAPSHFIIGGVYDGINGTVTTSRGENTAWWASTATHGNHERAYLMDLRVFVMNISNGNYYRYNGCLVRCVAH